MPRYSNSLPTGTLETLNGLNLNFERSAAKKLSEIARELSLRLPAGEDYYLELQGRTMHVYGQTQGIRKYDFKDDTRASSFEITSEGIEVSLSKSGISKIVLHLAPLGKEVDAVSREEANAPVDLLREYSALDTKKTLTPTELRRKGELLEKIRSDFLKQPPSSSYGSYASTPSSWGESRGGVGGRAAG